MEITFLGTGTSQGVPVIACDCEVCMSNNPKDTRLRSSIHVQHENTSIVVDTGPDFRIQMLDNNIQSLDAVLYTHEHRDHTAGLDDIRPYYYKKGSAFDVYATERVQDFLKASFSYIFHEKRYPGVPELNLNTIGTETFNVGDFRVIPIEVLHYKLPVLGFRFGDFTYITDANFISEKEMEKIEGSKILVLNALRIEPHISHYNLDEAIQVASRIGAEKTYFTHISHLLGRHNDIEKVLPESIHLAYDGLGLTL